MIDILSKLDPAIINPKYCKFITELSKSWSSGVQRICLELHLLSDHVDVSFKGDFDSDSDFFTKKAIKFFGKKSSIHVSYDIDPELDLYKKSIYYPVFGASTKDTLYFLQQFTNVPVSDLGFIGVPKDIAIMNRLPLGITPQVKYSGYINEGWVDSLPNCNISKFIRNLPSDYQYRGGYDLNTGLSKVGIEVFKDVDNDYEYSYAISLLNKLLASSMNINRPRVLALLDFFGKREYDGVSYNNRSVVMKYVFIKDRLVDVKSYITSYKERVC